MSYSKVCDLISKIRKEGTVVVDTNIMKIIKHDCLGSCIINKKDGVEESVKLCL